MPRRTRKKPVTTTPGATSSSSSHTPQSTRTLIRKFHTLKKKEVTLLSDLAEDCSHAFPKAIYTAQNDLQQLEHVKDEIDRLGGLEAYQNMSSVGQSDDRGGGSEKVLVRWLLELQPLPDTIGKGKAKEKIESVL